MAVACVVAIVFAATAWLEFNASSAFITAPPMIVIAAPHAPPAPRNASAPDTKTDAAAASYGAAAISTRHFFADGQISNVLEWAVSEYRPLARSERACISNGTSIVRVRSGQLSVYLDPPTTNDDPRTAVRTVYIDAGGVPTAPSVIPEVALVVRANETIAIPPRVCHVIANDQSQEVLRIDTSIIASPSSA